MKLHELKNTFNRQSRRRVGRGDGSGHGRTCGRGDKGAGQRSGYSRRPHFEGGQIPLFRRLPKRGFKNPNHIFYTVVNVGQLEQNFDDKSEICENVLHELGLISKSTSGLKILGNGELTKALTITAAKFSESARRKIEAAGGSCQVG